MYMAVGEDEQLMAGGGVRSARRIASLVQRLSRMGTSAL
jgi:hypothetical protein